MRVYKADKTPLNILRAIITVLMILLLIICKQFIPSYILMIILMSVFTITGTALIFAYIPAMFRNIEIHIGENIITKKNGVFFKRKQTINISSVQYVTTVVSILPKINGLNFIILNIYGGIMILPFLSNNDFKEIMTKVNINTRSD